MQADIIEVMHQQVRAIHRALTGDDVPDAPEPGGDPPPTEANDGSSDAAIAERFAQLEQLARIHPSLAEVVPPFSFTPPTDVLTENDAIVLELAVPGVRRDEITLERHDDALVVSGVRRDDHAARGRRFHAEIPRGPFFRVIPLPCPISGEPRVELADGLLRIYLTIQPADVRGDDDDVPPDTVRNKGPEEKTQ